MENKEFNRVVEMFPENKRKGQMDALIIWNNLSNADKNKVFNHIPVYMANTAPMYIRQIGKYFQDRAFEKKSTAQLKKNLGTKKQLLDGEFISYLQNVMEIENIDEVVNNLIDMDSYSLNEAYRLYLEDKARNKSYYMGDIVAQSTNPFGVNYWRDKNDRHYFGVFGKPMIKLSNADYKQFCDNLYVFTSEDTENKRKITPKELKTYMIHCIKEANQAHYKNPHQEILDVQKIKEALV